MAMILSVENANWNWIVLQIALIVLRDLMNSLQALAIFALRITALPVLAILASNVSMATTKIVGNASIVPNPVPSAMILILARFALLAIYLKSWQCPVILLALNIALLVCPAMIIAILA